MEASCSVRLQVIPLRSPSMQIPYVDNAYCKYEMVSGEDWQLLDGMETGITQVSRLSSGTCRLHVNRHQPPFMNTRDAHRSYYRDHNVGP